MTEISATDASKNFADMLDAVEHRGETFVVIRRGRAVATVAPARHANISSLHQLLIRHHPDELWERDLAEIRSLAGSQTGQDPWSE